MSAQVLKTLLHRAISMADLSDDDWQVGDKRWLNWTNIQEI